MKSFEALVMRLSEAALAGNIHHQHRLARVSGKINLRIESLKLEQSSMITHLPCVQDGHPLTDQRNHQLLVISLF